MLGTVIAERYEIAAEIGRGGMAVVYRASDLRLNRSVALKILHPHLASQKESAARFVRESQAIAKLNHPNIIEIYDASRDPKSQSHYLVMELIEGPTLKDFLDSHPIQIPEIGLAMIACLCDALQHAHDRGIIHRDIKPENIMIDADGTLKLMDFGIARILDSDRLTASGSLLGSPAHMPPEIIEGQPYNETCDIFSLGTVFYYCITNLLPFRGETPVAILKAILDSRYLAPSRVKSTISRACDKLVAKCLATSPKDRYQSAKLLKKELLIILEDVSFQAYADEVIAYFSEPDDYQKKMLPLILERLNKNALEQIKKRRIPLAVDFLNRVLSYDPNNPTARETLVQIRRSNLRLYISRAAILICILLIISWLGYDYTQTHHAKPPNDIAKRAQNPNITSTKTSLPLENKTSLSVQRKSPSNASNAKAKSKSRLKLFLDDVFKALESFDTQKADAGTLAQKEAIEKPQTTTKPSSKAVTVPRRSVRTPKKHLRDEKTASQKNTAKSAEKNKADEALSDAQKATLDLEKTKIHIVQPVFPPDAFAIIAGQRYNANASGDIHLELEPGNYEMVLDCHERCIQQRQKLDIKTDESSKTRDVISLPWADATITLTPPKEEDSYFVARRLDDKSQRILHLVARTPNSIGGFNAFGRPIQLEVYAIPKTRILTSYEAVDLERAKLASTRLSLSPGEDRSLSF